MHTSKDSMWRGIWKILQNFWELNKAYRDNQCFVIYMDMSCSPHCCISRASQPNQRTELFVMMKIIYYMIWYPLTGNTCSHPFPYTLSRHWTGEQLERTKVLPVQSTNKPRNKKRHKQHPSKLIKNERIQRRSLNYSHPPVLCVTLRPKNLPGLLRSSLLWPRLVLPSSRPGAI